MATAQDVRAALAEVADSGDAEFLQRYFQTGPGWDLVDASSEFIVGEHLLERDRTLLSRDRLTGFLDAHAAGMPRTMLSYATEHLEPEDRARYRAMR